VVGSPDWLVVGATQAVGSLHQKITLVSQLCVVCPWFVNFYVLFCWFCDDMLVKIDVDATTPPLFQFCSHEYIFFDWKTELKYRFPSRPTWMIIKWCQNPQVHMVYNGKISKIGNP
jgi:hypothetical protein